MSKLRMERTTKWLGLLAAAVVFLCNASAASAAERYKLECNDGAYVTGFTGRAGDWVDALGLVCAHWNADKASLDASAAGPPLVGESEGGAPTDANCPKGYAVAGGYRIDYTQSDGTTLLHHIEFDCHPVGGDGGVVSLRFGSTSNAEIANRPADRRTCAPGELVSGVRGRHGLFIDELRLICSAGPSVAIVTKPAGPAVLRDPGVAPKSNSPYIGGQ